MDFVYREDCLNEEEFLKLKEMAESKRGLWLRKAAEHGSREAQYYLGILLYSDSKKEALDWLNKARSQDYQPAENVLLQRQRKFLKTGFIGKIFNKKSSENREALQEAERQENPEFLGLCRLAEEGDLEAKFFAAREYDEMNLQDTAIPLYLEAAWGGNLTAMERAARYYVEGKKDLHEASFWYERVRKRGKPTMEDPIGQMKKEEKDFFYFFNFSSKQKEVLGLDAEVLDYESFRDGHFIK